MEEKAETGIGRDHPPIALKVSDKGAKRLGLGPARRNLV
jgi:hypothetical protein